MTGSGVQIDAIVSSPFEENTFVVTREGRDDCLVVDPGLQPADIIEHCDSTGRRPAAMLITHGHSDHIGGLAALKRRWPDCPVVIGVNDAPKLTDAQLNLSAMFGLPLAFAPADEMLEDGSEYEAAGIAVRAMEIPGHSIGHMVYLIDGPAPQVVLVGDVIFAGSIGRTDFPDGDLEALLNGIRTKLFTLPDETILLPGHGPGTTVSRERRTNPFLR